MWIQYSKTSIYSNFKWKEWKCRQKIKLSSLKKQYSFICLFINDLIEQKQLVKCRSEGKYVTKNWTTIYARCPSMPRRVKIYWPLAYSRLSPPLGHMRSTWEENLPYNILNRIRESIFLSIFLQGKYAQ